MNLPNYQIQKITVDRYFIIWLCLILLTLVSAFIGESGSTNIGLTLFICAIVIIKDRWVIDEFMGLKNASPLSRNIVKGYFYSMTYLVGLTVIYTQSSL